MSARDLVDFFLNPFDSAFEICGSASTVSIADNYNVAVNAKQNDEFSFGIFRRRKLRPCYK